ncbi:MAG TPA: universal stress protein [Nitrospirae bacterium]|nr:universal stress protein family protein [bacterium BMS3Abin06]HDH12713.1 universal stress protein [Nitrospirota bacterium]HDZ00022.1 universal stress protein [Nitrospirota bacterium]
MENSGKLKDRHILIALDESENARRALLYAADFLGGTPGFRATLLRIIPEPPEDYFDSDEERNKWIEDRRSTAKEMLENYRKILIQSGFREDKVDVLINVRSCPSVAKCILDEQKRLGCCTVVVGRRGISKKEEFIFGSTSNKILHNGKNCAVWVIE